MAIWGIVSFRSQEPAVGASVVLTGEVIDLGCYLADGAAGPGHAACAKQCIENGVPVGLKVKGGKIYLLVANNIPPHGSLNDQLSQYAAKTVMISGVVAKRGGIRALEGARLAGQIESSRGHNAAVDDKNVCCSGMKWPLQASL